MVELVGAIPNTKENNILSKRTYYGSICQQLSFAGLPAVLSLLKIRALSMGPRTRQIEGIAPRAKRYGSRNPSANFNNPSIRQNFANIAPNSWTI